MRPTRRASKRRDGRYKSGLEAEVAKQIEQLTGTEAAYETFKVEYTKPERKHRYTPDFILPNGIVVECKGLFDAADREKHILVKQAHPDMDLRIVFSRLHAPIYKGSPTTHADWCRKQGIKCAEKLIPLAWFKETLKCA